MSRLRAGIWVGAALLMLLPLLATLFSDAFNWDGIDFAIFGALLGSVCLTFELASRKQGNPAYQTAVAVALVTAFILIWVTLAVGIIGSESNVANLMFVGVLVVGVAGAIMARFRPHGMARALFAMAAVQVLVALVALVAGFGSDGSVWPLDILLSSWFFAALWLISAWLFRIAARVQVQSL